jgi:hypothetical protein
MTSAQEVQMQIEFYRKQIERISANFERHYMLSLIDITFDIISYEICWQAHICAPVQEFS